MHLLFDKIAWAGGILILVWAINVTYVALRRGLRNLPGPWLAKVSPLWRLRLVWNGLAHEEYRKLHDKYGPVVWTAPYVVDVSDQSAVPEIYGINSKFIKSSFYHTMDMDFEGVVMPSMFTTISPDKHKALKRPVAQKFSMTSVRTLEYLVDPCSEIFTTTMKHFQGDVVDLGVWVQWYAFDVIGAMTFGERFGFMENRKDVENVISGIEDALMYASVVGQVPSLHRFLRGSSVVRKLLRILGLNDSMETVTKMVLRAVESYDTRAIDDTERADFLAYLRQQQKSTGQPMPRNELMNHLMNNLLAGSDTTAISLRAVFYYVIRDSRIYKRLQKEIDDFHAAGKLSPYITYGESLEMEYL